MSKDAGAHELDDPAVHELEGPAVPVALVIGPTDHELLGLIELLLWLKEAGRTNLMIQPYL